MTNYRRWILTILCTLSWALLISQIWSCCTDSPTYAKFQAGMDESLAPIYLDFMGEVVENRGYQEGLTHSLWHLGWATSADLGAVKSAADLVGLCIIEWDVPGGVEYRTVLIHQEYQFLSPIVLRLLVYHELGHCLLNQDHPNKVDPMSIMQPVLPSTQFIEENFSQMLDHTWPNQT